MKKLLAILLTAMLVFTLSACSESTGVPSIDDAKKYLSDAGYSIEYLDYKDNGDIQGEGIKAENGDEYIVIVWYNNPDFKAQARDFFAQFYLNAPCISSRNGVYYCSTPAAMEAAQITPIKIG